MRQIVITLCDDGGIEFSAEGGDISVLEVLGALELAKHGFLSTDDKQVIGWNKN